MILQDHCFYLHAMSINVLWLLKENQSADIIILINNSNLSITYYFIRVIQYHIFDGSITKNSQYLCSVCDNHVKALLDQKKNISSKEEDKINDTDKNDIEGNTIANQVEDLIKTLNSSKIKSNLNTDLLAFRCFNFVCI